MKHETGLTTHLGAACAAARPLNPVLDGANRHDSKRTRVLHNACSPNIPTGADFYAIGCIVMIKHYMPCTAGDTCPL